MSIKYQVEYRDKENWTFHLKDGFNSKREARAFLNENAVGFCAIYPYLVPNNSDPNIRLNKDIYREKRIRSQRKTRRERKVIKTGNISRKSGITLEDLLNEDY